MKLENQICTLNQAIKLKNLEVPQKSLFFWEVSGKRSEIKQAAEVDISKSFSAFNVAELGLLLPCLVPLEEEDYYLQGTIGNREGEFYYIWFQSSIDNVEWELFPAIEKDTEAEARAEALIWLLENDFLKAEELEI